ncbi:MAG: zinc ABC transporter substrate-binding protein [Desulfobacterales bacterium]|nr:zinc ABC transporter substrate-binding protein [Desulfobacterales bacterium]
MKRIGFVVVGAMIFLGGILSGGEASELKKVQVFVSILPQKAFVEHIGGDRVDVSVLVSPGESPATYRPKPSRIAKLAASNIYFRVGVPFENQLLPKVKGLSRELLVVDTRKGIALRQMRGHHEHGDHHHDGEDHEGADPHIWLDPMRVKRQAEIIRDALSAFDPQGRKTYEKGYLTFASELDALHDELKQALEPVKGSVLYVYHPAFGYFAEAYGLVQKAVEVEGKRPKGKTLSKFIQQAKRDKARVIFVQPQFDRHAAEKIAHAIGGSVVALDPLSEDYLKNLKKMATNIIRVQSHY